MFYFAGRVHGPYFANTVQVPNEHDIVRFINI